MAEYIKREDALNCFSCDLGKKDHSVSYQGFMVEAAFRINDIPSADVVEVVRCKDCKHRRKITLANGTVYWECELDSADSYDQSRHAEDDDWFCADGEAK